MFWHLGKPVAVRTVERALHGTAAVEHIMVGGTSVAVYTWGAGDSMILLVHGWRSRASRFTHLVKVLTDDGHTIVSFDAPGHGASGKGPSNVFEWARIVLEVEARFGHFDAVIGHSFGVLAAFQAVRTGLTTDRMATIAGVHSLEHLVTTFTRIIQLPPRARVRFRSRIQQFVVETSSFAWEQIVSQFDSARDSLPLLVVHDTADTVVDIQQAELIADAHTGPTSVLFTAGLGHNRILADSRVLDALVRFVRSKDQLPVQEAVDHDGS
jgi:pimeloyl-ACP methyl ester carboxylesterase